MPIHRIQTSEYECRRCGYKWINRTNGIDGPIPRKCAKCKRIGWNRKPMSGLMIGIRQRIKNLGTLYEGAIKGYKWPHELTQQLLALKPSPPLADLQQVLWSARLRLDSQNKYSLRSKKRIYDQERWNRLLQEDAERIQGTMQAVIDYYTRKAT